MARQCLDHAIIDFSIRMFQNLGVQPYDFLGDRPMSGPSDMDEVSDEVPDEYWDTPEKRRIRRLLGRIRVRHVVVLLVVAVVVAVGFVLLRGGWPSHHSPRTSAIPPPVGASSVDGQAFSPSPWPVPPPASSVSASASASASAAPATSVSANSSTPVPAASATTAMPDTGTVACTDLGSWSGLPRQQYVNAYLPAKVVIGAKSTAQCDGVFVFTPARLPQAMLNAPAGYRIGYVARALTYEPGKPGRPVALHARYVLWLQVNAPASGYEAGAPASEGRFRPGDHMADAKGLAKFFTAVRDLVFLGSDQHVSYYAFGLDKMGPFKIWVQANNQHQKEWALMIQR